MSKAKSLLTTAALVLLSTVAHAAPAWVDYSDAAFAEAQAAGQTILVDVYASWCPVCKVQGPILDELREEAALESVVFMKVDYDVEKAFLQDHRIPRQSTILIFAGAEEVGRSIAESDRERLRSFVLSTAAN